MTGIAFTLPDVVGQRDIQIAIRATRRMPIAYPMYRALPLLFMRKANLPRSVVASRLHHHLASCERSRVRSHPRHFPEEDQNHVDRVADSVGDDRDGEIASRAQVHSAE